MALFSKSKQKQSRPDRPFEPIRPNPYIVANPIRTREMFYGREDDFTFVRQRLETETQGVIVVFVGERRCGKSSILYQILGGRLGEDFLPVLVDMQYMAAVARDDPGFYTHFAGFVCSALNHDDLKAEAYDFESRGAGAFEGLIDDIHRIYPGKKLVFLVDEYEWLEEKVNSGTWSGDVLLFMASLLEHKGVSFLFTGSSRLQELRNDAWRVMMGKAVHRRVSFLTPNDTTRLIKEPVQGRVDYDEGVTEAILRLTTGHPFYTQVLCQNIVDHLNVEERNYATEDDLSVVVETEVENPKPQMLFAWEGFSDQEQVVLSLMAERLRDEKDRVSARQITQAVAQHGIPLDLAEDSVRVSLEGLFEREILDKRRDEYWFRMDLLRQWIVRSRSIWQVINELGLVAAGSVTPVAAAPPRRKWMLSVAAVVVLFIALVLYWPGAEPPPVPPAPPVKLSTVGMLHIASTPGGAEIYIEGDSLSHDPTPVIVNLSPGWHRVTVSKAGYVTVTDSVEIIAGEQERLNLALAQQRGRVMVGSNPVGAQIYVDGENRGITPMALELTVGIHDIRLTRSGFATMTSQVDVLADQTVEQTVELLRAVGRVAIGSNPAGARVFLDDETGSRGVTPMEINQLAPGSHTLRLRLDGYSEIRQPFTVTANDINRLAMIQLSRSQGQLTVVSIPPAGDVYLDGNHLGQTPYSTTDVTPGPHQLRITRTGYAPVERTVDVVVGANPPVTITLDRLYGNLELRVIPYGYVFIDGESQGAPQPWVKVRLGAEQQYKIRITNPVFQDSIFTIKTSVGDTIRRIVRLTNRKE